MLENIPKTAKDIDAVVFKRVVRRLLSDRVDPKDFERIAKQAEVLFKEVMDAVRYEKQFLTNPQPSTKKEKRMIGEHETESVLKNSSYEFTGY